MMEKPSLGSRAKNVARGLAKAGLRGVIVAPGPNLRYLTGVSSFLMERPFMFFAVRGSFLRLLELPTGFEIDQATATFTSAGPGL